MKILIVRMYPDSLNIKNYNCQEIGLAKALIRKGNVCDIVLYTDKSPYEEDVAFDTDNKIIHIYYLNAKKILKNAFFNSRLYDIAKDYDIIQTSEYDQIGNALLKKKLKNKMIIYHGPYDSDYTRGYKKKCLISDLCFLFSKEYKNTPCIAKSDLAKKFLNKKGFGDVTTIGVGLDTERFEKNIETNERINELIENKKNNNVKYLLYIGKIEDRRNILFLLETFELTLLRDENIKLIIVGKGEEQYIKKCTKIIEEKNLENKIIYFESLRQEELPNLFKYSDIFLLPTKYEIFGMVLLESMCFGLPVITSLNGGSSTLIKDKKNGFIIDSFDAQKWAECIYNYLNKKELTKINSKAIEYSIKDNFTWDKLSDKFVQVYKRALK